MAAAPPTSESYYPQSLTSRSLQLYNDGENHMSPEAENIFEMPPHLFFSGGGGASCPFWAKLRMAGRQGGFFFFFFPRQLERVILGVIGGDKALIQLGQVAPRPPTRPPAHPLSAVVAARPRLCSPRLFVCPGEAGPGRLMQARGPARSEATLNPSRLV